MRVRELIFRTPSIFARLDGFFLRSSFFFHFFQFFRRFHPDSPPLLPCRVHVRFSSFPRVSLSLALFSIASSSSSALLCSFAPSNALPPRSSAATAPPLCLQIAQRYGRENFVYRGSPSCFFTTLFFYAFRSLSNLAMLVLVAGYDCKKKKKAGDLHSDRFSVNISRETENNRSFFVRGEIQFTLDVCVIT